MIPSEVHSIERYAFLGNRSIENLIIPAHVKVIVDRAFMYCVSLRVLEIAEGVVKIGNEAFSCTALKTVSIPRREKK